MVEADIYKQLTYVDGVLKYKRHIDSDKLVQLIAQAMILKQCGEDITLDVQRNDKFEITSYNIKRIFENGKVVYIVFEKRAYKGRNEK